jgi:hypothetical protein
MINTVRINLTIATIIFTFFQLSLRLSLNKNLRNLSEKKVKKDLTPL